MSQIAVVLEDLATHPQCTHGPTILFSRTTTNGAVHKFFACAACRDRKDCAFYLDETAKDTESIVRKERWKVDKQNYVQAIKHRKLFVMYNKVLQLPMIERQFCYTCSTFLVTNSSIHNGHNITVDIDDYHLQHPTEFLSPLDNPKKEAQFLFSKLAVKTIVDILLSLELRNVVCMGAPRIHEYIISECPKMNSILLDFDKRYHSFFGPLQFCWYNMFNNYFFLSEAKQVFKDFLKTDRGEGLVLIMDPPFGGRVELLAQTTTCINELYSTANNFNKLLPILWAFPYFMEPQILNSLPEFCMLDYKVDYDNHPLFQDGPKGRKLGSPVRLFTNLDPCTIKLPSEQGYKYCNLCKKWVYNENKHCNICKACTSKDGRTYIHCSSCQRCVKPTWKHCDVCQRCAQPDHRCQELTFSQACFHCKEMGHKKRQCPQINHEHLRLKEVKVLKRKARNGSSYTHYNIQNKRSCNVISFGNLFTYIF